MVLQIFVSCYDDNKPKIGCQVLGFVMILMYNILYSYFFININTGESYLDRIYCGVRFLPRAQSIIILNIWKF